MSILKLQTLRQRAHGHGLRSPHSVCSSLSQCCSEAL
ncbi:class III lanthipeptide [Dactylosporangium salmoneum]